ncbi:MAG: multiheme c-type cytochrome [Candidatus Rokuibacteriota bacterium]
MSRPIGAALLVLALGGGVRAVGADAIDDFVARHWKQPLAPQGSAPARATALEASLHPEACGACHPQQYADWRTSPHAASMGPGVAGQLVELLASEPGSALGCQNCHAPLAEQRPLDWDGARATPNAIYDGRLRQRGLVCAGCHVRDHERFGPPKRDGSLASAAPRETLPHNGVTRTPAFLKSEFCASCHQFAPDGFRVNGKLLENTYAEWRASRFAREGVHCQDCHMPDRRHLWRGIHDPEMVRSGLTIEATMDGSRDAPGGTGTATLRVTNTGVGHAFPTYIPPRVVLRGELIGADGRALAGSRQEYQIARDAELDLATENFDTRLMPGESAALVYRTVVVAPGVRLRLSVVVYPDWFYARFFQALLQQGAGRGAELVREALEAARRSPYVLFERDFPLT